MLGAKESRDADIACVYDETQGNAFGGVGKGIRSEDVQVVDCFFVVQRIVASGGGRRKREKEAIATLV